MRASSCENLVVCIYVWMKPYTKKDLWTKVTAWYSAIKSDSSQVEENDWSGISTVGWSQQSSKFIHLDGSDVEHPAECLQNPKSV